MKFLKKSIDEKPITAAFLVAIIVALICLIIFVNKYYQQEIEFPPKLVGITDSGEEVELLLLSYDWNYKGEQKTYQPDANVEDLKTYDFNGKNTVFGKFEFGINNLEMRTQPKYKAKGFSTNALRYQYPINEYQSTNSAVLDGKEKSKLSYPVNYDTSLVTITLYSETQGKAVYGLKTVETSYIDMDEIKQIKNLDLKQEAISNFMKSQIYGQYLDKVEVQDNRVIFTYDYYIEDRATLMYTNVLFALIDNLEEVEFKFTYDKYVKNHQDATTYQVTKEELDHLDPIIYSRNSFVDTALDVTLEELRTYIGK